MMEVSDPQSTPTDVEQTAVKPEKKQEMIRVQEEAARERANEGGYPMTPTNQEHVTTTEARAGATPHMTRYVLVFGTGLTIIAFAIILLVSG